MKRFITSIILFFLTIGACLIETIFLNNTVNNFTQDINYIIQNANNKNIDKALQLANDINIKWQEQQAFISTFINHDRLEDISQSIISLKASLHQQQIEDFFVECEIAKSQLNHLKDTEFPSIQNIL